MRIFGRGWILLVLCIFSMNNATVGQVSKDKKNTDVIISKGRPDIPGELGIDFGFVQGSNIPSKMQLNFISSYFISPFYKYEVFIPKTNFSVLFGLSVGCEKYRFINHVTIIKSLDENNKYTNQLVNLDTVYAERRIKKSLLAVNYIEIPLELRFRSNHRYPKNAFNISVGGKIGFLIDSHTKYKYYQDGENKIQKQKESFDINRIRYELTGRIGYGNFNLFYYYSLNSLFETDKAPLRAEINPMTFGISLSLF